MWKALGSIRTGIVAQRPSFLCDNRNCRIEAADGARRTRFEGWKSGGAGPGRVCCQGLEPRLEVGKAADRGRSNDNRGNFPFHHDFSPSLLHTVHVFIVPIASMSIATCVSKGTIWRPTHCRKGRHLLGIMHAHSAGIIGTAPRP